MYEDSHHTRIVDYSPASQQRRTGCFFLRAVGDEATYHSDHYTVISHHSELDDVWSQIVIMSRTINDGTTDRLQRQKEFDFELQLKIDVDFSKSIRMNKTNSIFK